MEVATSENTKVGTRVIKGGPHWDWHPQGEGSAYGIVDDVRSHNWVMVHWYSKDGERLDGNTYRIGGSENDTFDLYLADSFSLNGNIKNNG